MYKFLYEHMFSFLLGVYLGVEFLGHLSVEDFRQKKVDVTYILKNSAF